METRFFVPAQTLVGLALCAGYPTYRAARLLLGALSW